LFFSVLTQPPTHVRTVLPASCYLPADANTLSYWTLSSGWIRGQGYLSGLAISPAIPTGYALEEGYGKSQRNPFYGLGVYLHSRQFSVGSPLTSKQGGSNYNQQLTNLVNKMQNTSNTLGEFEIAVDLATPCNCYGNNGTTAPTAMQPVDAAQNSLRTTYGQPPLVWLSDLENSARTIALKCDAIKTQADYQYTVLLDTGNIPPPTLPTTGDIVAARYAAYSFTTGISWSASPFPISVETLNQNLLQESAYYNCINNTCSGFTCLHFLQVVDYHVTSYGCYINACTTNSPFAPQFPSAWNYLVCVYNQPVGAVGRPVLLQDCPAV